MQTPGRISSATSYRYGFNGQENDNEVKGVGNQVDFGARIYDPRIGRFLSLDPLQIKYPNETPYVFVSDNPVIYKDSDGRDKVVTITYINKEGGTTQIHMIDQSYFVYSPIKTNTTNAWNETFEKFKQDEYVNMTIDMSNPKNSSFSVTYGTPYKTSLFAGTLVEKWLSRGDESGTEKYGYRLFGNETNGSSPWVEGLPRAAPGSESLDLGTLLNIVGNWREFGVGSKMEIAELTSDIAEQLKVGSKYSSFLERLDNAMDGLGVLADLKSKNDASLLNTTPKIEPGKVYKGFKKGTIINTSTGNVRVDSDSTGVNSGPC